MVEDPEAGIPPSRSQVAGQCPGPLASVVVQEGHMFCCTRKLSFLGDLPKISPFTDRSLMAVKVVMAEQSMKMRTFCILDKIPVKVIPHTSLNIVKGEVCS